MAWVGIFTPPSCSSTTLCLAIKASYQWGQLTMEQLWHPQPFKVDCFRKVINWASNLKTQIPTFVEAEFVFLCHSDLICDSSLTLLANRLLREEMTWPRNNSYPHICALELISSLNSTQYKPHSNCVTRSENTLLFLFFLWFTPLETHKNAHPFPDFHRPTHFQTFTGPFSHLDTLPPFSVVYLVWFSGRVGETSGLLLWQTTSLDVSPVQKNCIMCIPKL